MNGLDKCNKAFRALDDRKEALENEERVSKMNDYEKKIAEKKARMEALTNKAQHEAEKKLSEARAMADRIPMGQPILIGHHRERADRRYRDRISNKTHQGIDALKKAEYYERKAAAVGKGGISSDDPDAIKKLRAELEEKEASQAMMKEANKIVKAKKKTDVEKLAELAKLGLSPKAAAECLAPDFCGRIGFASYALSNNNANMKRIKKRIEQLEAAAELEDIEEVSEAYTYAERDNRIQFIFDGKPSDEIRAALKKWAFKWSPSRDAWVRNRNNGGRYAAEQVKRELESLV